MDKTKPSAADIENGQQLADQLRNAGIVVERSYWRREDEPEWSTEWRFHIVSPDVATRGPLTIYRMVDEALGAMPSEQRLAPGDIHVWSPGHEPFTPP